MGSSICKAFVETHETTDQPQEDILPTTENTRYTFEEDDWPWVWALRDPTFLDWKEGRSTDEVVAIAKQQNDLPVQIDDLIYLGNAHCIQNIDRLQKIGIRRVLNMAGPFALKKTITKALRARGFVYKQIPADDEFEYPLLERHWDQIHAFLKDAEDANELCVVHCVAGQNRSVLAVAAFYMLKHQCSVLDAMKHVRMKRGNTALSSNEGFQEQLVAFARIRGFLGEKPACTVMRF